MPSTRYKIGDTVNLIMHQGYGEYSVWGTGVIVKVDRAVRGYPTAYDVKRNNGQVVRAVNGMLRLVKRKA